MLLEPFPLMYACAQLHDHCCPFFRAAMLGFALAVVAFAKTNKNINQKISSWPQPVFAVFALIAVGTLVPILR